jgi:major membrane immunogen (membrane-anchored lipoprotein)
MKRDAILLFVLFLILFPCLLLGQDTGLKGAKKEVKLKYRNGIFSGQSRSVYTDEPYWGMVTITVRKGLIKDVDYIVRDSVKHETFSEKYERHFADIPEYVQQCRNDWKGIQTYPNKFLESQDISKLDAVSGATWSYNIFKASTEEALKKAVR